MISTRVFSRQASIWGALTPTLEHVVRWMNANAVRTAKRVPASGGDPSKNSLIAEVAFAVAATMDPIPERIDERHVVAIRTHLARFSVNPPDDSELDEDELEEVLGLSRSLMSILPRLGEGFEFWPSIPGCGIVDAAHADVRAGATLVEVKSVSRNFRAPDVRQLLTYCAMLDAQGARPTRLALVNPRLGLSVSASLEFVAQGASGVAGAGLMREIARRMSEIQVSA